MSNILSKDMDPETVLEEAFLVGESDSMPDSDEEQEAIQDTRTPSQPKGHSGSECLGNVCLEK